MTRSKKSSERNSALESLITSYKITCRITLHYIKGCQEPSRTTWENIQVADLRVFICNRWTLEMLQLTLMLLRPWLMVICDARASLYSVTAFDSHCLGWIQKGSINDAFTLCRAQTSIGMWRVIINLPGVTRMVMNLLLLKQSQYGVHRILACTRGVLQTTAHDYCTQGRE